jgi:hypothetical protein
LYVLAACADSENAYEPNKPDSSKLAETDWQHSCLAKALLEVLRGEQPTSSVAAKNDGKITVDEAFQYCKVRAAQLAARVGEQQAPKENYLQSPQVDYYSNPASRTIFCLRP